MTREEFIQQLLLGHTIKETSDALTFFDSEAGYYAENEAVTKFIDRSKNFTTFRLITPYGDFPIAVDKKAVMEVARWLNSKNNSYGIGLQEMIKR